MVVAVGTGRRRQRLGRGRNISCGGSDLDIATVVGGHIGRRSPRRAVDGRPPPRGVAVAVPHDGSQWLRPMSERSLTAKTAKLGEQTCSAKQTSCNISVRVERRWEGDQAGRVAFLSDS